MAIRVKGLEEVLSNLNKEIAGIKGRALDGLWDAGLQVQRVAQQELQASVVTGNLRASAYTRKSGQLLRLDDNQLDRDKAYQDPSGTLGGVEIGFTAMYALMAHENMEGRAPKYLEGPLRRNRKQIFEIIRKRAEMKS